MDGITGFKLADGTTVIRSVVLPNNTMYVSADIYDLLVKGQEEAERQHSELMAKVDQFNALVARAKEQH